MQTLFAVLACGQYGTTQGAHRRSPDVVDGDESPNLEGLPRQ